MPRFTKTDGTIPRDVNTQLPLSEHPSQLFYTQSGPKAPHEGETEPALVDASLTYSTDHHCIASRMNSDSEIESESSLPTRPAPIFPSSPPAIQRTEASFGNIEEMDNAPHFKSEPPATQIDEASKPPLRRVSSDETERPPSAQQAQGDAHDHVHESDEEDEEELDSDPAETIADFDWDALHERYHNAMNGCHEQEGELAQEWESLMNYFRIWADSGHDQETDRTFKRLKTRTTYVQNSEDELEKTRNHYISVVKAFESALNLLKAHGFHG